MGIRVILFLSACVIAAVSAGTVNRELRALNHLVNKVEQSVEKLAKRERQVCMIGWSALHLGKDG